MNKEQGFGDHEILLQCMTFGGPKQLVPGTVVKLY